MRFKLLIIGPFPPPIHGNSLVNKVAFETLQSSSKVRVDKIDTSLGVFDEKIGELDLRKVLVYLGKYLYLYKILITDLVYLTPGQTFYGVVKYMPYIFLARLLRKKIVLHIHGGHLAAQYKNLSGLKKKMVHKTISLADEGIVLSKSLRSVLTPFLPVDRIVELSNFIEDDLLDFDLSEKIKTKFDRLRILYLSNLMREKGITDFLRALLILKRNKVPFSAMVAGNVDVDLEKEVKGYLRKLGSSVIYHGPVGREKAKKLFCNANVFVFPTYYRIEGQPLVLLEAMGTGNVVLTTRHAGIPDVFSDNVNGFYVNKRDPGDIARKLKIICKGLDSMRAISQRNHRYVKEKFTVDVFAGNLYKILSSVVKEKYK